MHMSINWLKLHSSHLARVIAGLALVGALVVQCIGAWTDSQTTDEGAHLAAGLSYWRTNDFRLNPEHPALVKLLAAAPLIPFHQLQPSADPGLWASRNEWEIGRLVLYHQLDPRTETQKVLWLARLPMIMIWLGLGLVVWRWATERTSTWGGTIAAVLYAFEPTLLGHGHLITTDVAVAAGMTATLWLSTKLVARPTWRMVGAIAVVFSLTQLTKFSALILWPLLFGLLAIATTMRPTQWNWSWWRRAFAATILISAMTTWAVYGFEVQPAQADPRIDQLWAERDALAVSLDLATMPPLIQRLTAATAPGSGLRSTLVTLSRVPIPAYSYWRGIFAVTSHGFWGHAAYLFGQQSSQGWWYYFPVALAVKTPLPILGLGLVLVVMAGRRWRKLWSVDNLLLIAPMLGYMFWSLSSRIDIGIRHILPVYPLFFVAVAGLVPMARHSWQRWALGLSVASLPLIALVAWPNTFGYFNALAGGTRGGHRILLDSNMDWNQDLWRLRDELDAESTPPAMIALFGSVPVEVVHPHPGRVPTDTEVAIDGRPHGLVIISKGILYNIDLPYRWLQDIPPTKTIGSSIYMYDFR